MKISIVVAVSENNAIGKDNQLLWHLPNDLKMFKAITSGHCIIMGRKTFESIGKPLPNRTSIVISHQKNLTIEGCHVVANITDAIEFAKSRSETEAFIIGGGQIYNLLLPIAQHIYLTKVHAKPVADVFFPEMIQKEWKKISSESHLKDEKHDFDYDFEIWERIE